MLIAHPKGHYHFLQGIDPYSCGIIADPGYEIIHVTLAEALPWRAGFERVDAVEHRTTNDLGLAAWDGVWVWGCGRIWGEMCRFSCRIVRLHYKI